MIDTGYKLNTNILLSLNISTPITTIAAANPTTRNTTTTKFTVVVVVVVGMFMVGGMGIETYSSALISFLCLVVMVVVFMLCL